MRAPEKYIILDLETTGLSAERDCIIEIGAIKVIHGKVSKDIFSMLIKPESGYIPMRITSLTGITQGMAESKGIEIGKALRLFEKYAEGLPVIGWNIQFDIRFMDAAYRRHMHKSYSPESIDLLPLARRLKPGMENYKLNTIARAYGYENRAAHRAIGDCAAVLKIYQGMQREADRDKRCRK